jgi:predicted nucleotidyltransferase
MNIRDLTICGRPARELRDLFRKYDDAPTPSYFKDGNFIRVKRLLTPQFVAERLSLSLPQSKKLLQCLRNEGLLESECDVPTQKAAALKNASAMRKIKRETADGILLEVLKTARKINARRKARVKIDAIEAFGSYITDAEYVGDIDLWVILSHQGDYSQEVLDHEDLIGKKLRVSRYVSLHYEFDPIAATAKRKRVFP